MRCSWHKPELVSIKLHQWISVYGFSPVTGEGELLAALHLSLKEISYGFQAGWEHRGSPGWREVGINMNNCAAWVWHWHFLGCQIMDKCTRFPTTTGYLWPFPPFPGLALGRSLSPQASMAMCCSQPLHWKDQDPNPDFSNCCRKSWYGGFTDLSTTHGSLSRCLEICPELPGNPAQIEPPEARFSLTLEEYIFMPILLSTF